MGGMGAPSVCNERVSCTPLGASLDLASGAAKNTQTLEAGGQGMLVTCIP